jgi:hypothetical protein
VQFVEVDVSVLEKAMVYGVPIREFGKERSWILRQRVEPDSVNNDGEYLL